MIAKIFGMFCFLCGPVGFSCMVVFYLGAVTSTKVAFALSTVWYDAFYFVVLCAFMSPIRLVSIGLVFGGDF